MEKLYWTTKTGVKVDIDEMDINHLRNVLKMIVRNIEKEKLIEKKKALSNIEKKFRELRIMEDIELIEDIEQGYL